LDTIRTRGIVSARVVWWKIILPIWHDITKQEVQNFSPTLAGKMAMNTAIMTPMKLLKSSKNWLTNKNALD